MMAVTAEQRRAGQKPTPGKEGVRKEGGVTRWRWGPP